MCCYTLIDTHLHNSPTQSNLDTCIITTHTNWQPLHKPHTVQKSSTMYSPSTWPCSALKPPHSLQSNCIFLVPPFTGCAQRLPAAWAGDTSGSSRNLSSLPASDQRRPTQFPLSSPGQPQAGPQVLTVLHPQDKGPTWLSCQLWLVGRLGKPLPPAERESTLTRKRQNQGVAKPLPVGAGAK
jgi:hypothetical protein